MNTDIMGLIELILEMKAFQICIYFKMSDTMDFVSYIYA